MNTWRLAIWTSVALLVVGAIPYRRVGPLAGVRGIATVVAAVLFALWLVAGSVQFWRTFVRSEGRSRLQRAAGAAGGLLPWAAAMGLVVARCGGRTADAPTLTAAREATAARLESRVRQLAGEIGERHANGRLDALRQAAGWIATELQTAGWPVRQEPFEAPSGQGVVTVVNLVAERRGRVRPDELVLVGAHYDTVPGTPGANDNASGVAALLELATRWRSLEPDRTLRLVAFVNEEPPFFMTPHMGSEVHAAAAVRRGERIALMVALETMGCFRDVPGSQAYPSPLFYLLYPDRGNFIALVGGVRSAGALRRFAAAMRCATDVPVCWAALPMWVAGVAWSDHWPFARRGVPALMVTDTAPFRYDAYHQPDDLPEKLNYTALAAVVDGVAAAVLEAAGGGARDAAMATGG
ncbi:MAG: M20/M25/M40 family metallo-hydrolase [Kiritimatiellae bacterium]|nr:M20/M25/M40 family metallo-hydrolase [Kiritimatiellia bacterium]